MEDRHARTRAVIGEQGLRRLRESRVMVVGLGGVGSFAAEALARCGVGHLALVDGDCVEPSNLNRQLVALRSTLGMPKTGVMGQRIADIDETIAVTLFTGRVSAESVADLLAWPCDYLVDAIDSIADKAVLLTHCHRAGLPVVSSMGMGNRIDPWQLAVGDISAVHGCPLARRLRRALRAQGIETGIKVVFSRERPRRVAEDGGIIGSLPLVPPAAGIMMAAEVIRDLLGAGW
ncbi:MAG: ThiF family adenylyltransferase [Syntrophomonadaceae bacterium]|nr:ThiF family adenylyltransferase [Syntrophomonadaceae bacterium]MDH7497333.1 ThiF family adenylyltransferase [Syntrophomonadaceae bacterium]